ncbi:MAG: ABC transporter permease [Rhodanobacteraceae bacterium]|nr:ABC transporter permease [Rhodanobacteraceae bacterium]
MSGLQDFHIAMRSLRAHRGTALFATFTLALGLGAAIALYAVIDAILLRELPFPRADRIVALNELDANGKSMAMAWPNYADLTAGPDWQASAYFSSAGSPLASGGQVRRASATWTGGDFFRVFDIVPVRGRTFDAHEHEPVAVISNALWQGLLDVRGDVVGQPISVDGESLTVVGVMPAGFDYPAGTAVWTPWRDDPGSSRSAHNWSAVARLADDATLASVRLSAATLAARLLQEHGDDLDARAFGITPLAEAIAAPVRRALWLLAGGTLFLLLIAVTNVANLLLALNGSRAREMAVRAALGAAPSRLLREVVARGIADVGLGLGLGLVATLLGGQLLERFLFGVERGDPLALLVTLLVLLLAGLVATMTPALRAARIAPMTALRTD